MVGETLADRYRILERLQGGELLSTYLAADMAIGVEVEVDVMAACMSECTVSAQRLVEILDAAMRVRGPNVSPTHGWGEEREKGFFYVVREKAAGASLAEVLSGTGELPHQQVAEVARAAVEVLAEIYGNGLFYLGLNPGQIWLDGRGGVKFFRVGFAWVLEEMEPALAARVSPYRAPETDGGKEGSRTSDVYALAVMVREMMPRGEITSRLDSLLEMATDPLPRRRPSSSRLLLEELERAGSGGGHIMPHGESGGGQDMPRGESSGGSEGCISLARRPRRRALRKLLLALAGGMLLWVVFAAVAGLLGGKDSEQTPSPPPEEQMVTLPELQGLTTVEAETVLEGLGLEHVAREAPSRLWSAGRVAAHEPGEGAVLRHGETVCLVISTGREEVTPAAPTDGQGAPASTPGQAPPSSLDGRPSSLHAPPAAEPPPTVNAPPRAVPSLSACSGPAPLYVVMDGGNSYDPDGGIVRYVWDCGDGTVLEGASAQHVFDPAVIPASFRVVLVVYDAGGLSHSSTLTVKVF